ncbi:MAG: IPT/TIG domain-containing protein [Deltaproteobacteria bacterium]|nr:IPT/TIG domain-containing protein [Deltaproteobacteria bacterium]
MRAHASLLLILAGCEQLAAELPGYYDGASGPAPTIDSVESGQQNGNVGGLTVTITGSNFDDSAMVQFAQRNAVIQSLSDSEIVVTAPAGPMGGGTVTVTVGTANGFDTAEYVYDMGPDLLESSAGEDNVEGQAGDYDGADVVGYVLVNNFWESCYGGLSSRIDDTYGAVGCTEFAYIGFTGTSGNAEALEFAYPRLLSGYQGFFGATDLGDAQWRVQRPGEVAYSAAIEDFHVDLGSVRLSNSYYDDDRVCADMAQVASYRYGGGEDDAPAPYTVYGSGLPDVSKLGEGEACESGNVYEVGEMEFCARLNEEGVPDYLYEADYPVDRNFFASSRSGFDPVEVSLDMPEVGVDDVSLVLPESLVVYNTEGMGQMLEDTPGGHDLWSLSTFEHCFDDGDGGEDLDDTALTFEWKVSTLHTGEAEVGYPEVDGEVLGYRTYVRISFTELSLGWFGGIAYPVRATITVPDNYNTFEVGDGRDAELWSRLTVPASVMYQLPTVTPPGGNSQFGTLANPADDSGYLIAEFQRVTEYTIATEKGPVGFAYVTGDFGFYEWKNPTDDTCHDCLDGDGDGWIDELDPDCGSGTEELGGGDTACNDGADNDGDGLVDADDPECEKGSGDDESNCNNGRDDDGDGYEDEDDADCQRGDSEMYADGCVNGLDDDGDGWADTDDPDCLDDTEEAGVGAADCNDGIDGDGDGWIDASDPDCTSATGAEAGLGTGECNDGVDNDGNGDIDSLDPDCTSAEAGSETP